ncbi:MAG TPA: molybdopterin-dependent oxidoreductase, partial [Solirubrobacteraceae bacterium]|nr:molybdopterin-dependent oxidoreductase [Solirubrobacteraceae bacterium]
GLADVDGAGLLEVPATSNGRGLRESGVLPNAAPGLRRASEDGLDAPAIAAALGGGELTALYLIQADPLDERDPLAASAAPSEWSRAVETATTVIAHQTLLSAGMLEHATVIFPAESYAEKEGTVTHPDGRVQRVRQAVARAGSTRAGWQVLAELAEGLGVDTGVLGEQTASQALFEAVPFYAGLTLEQIGGRGVRWQQREAKS